jgi:prophage antirepressor-like protein
MNGIQLTTKDGVEGFYFDKTWIRIVRNCVNALGRPEEFGMIAADLAKALEQREANRVTRLLDPDQKGTHKVGTPQGEQEMSFVTESGFYDVVIRSNKPQGKALRSIVTREILPQIRKTGKYANHLQHQLNPEWQKTRTRSRLSRKKYGDAAKVCGAEDQIGRYTNEHYRVITGMTAKELQCARGTGPKGPIAKDLLRHNELIANEMMEMVVVQQVHVSRADTRDDFHAVESRVTMDLSQMLVGNMNIQLPSKAKKSSPYETYEASDSGDLRQGK